MSVVCKDCRFYRLAESRISSSYIRRSSAELVVKGAPSSPFVARGRVRTCTHPSCYVVKEKFDAAKGAVRVTKRKTGHALKNYRGDCPDYERKLWKFWR